MASTRMLDGTWWTETCGPLVIAHCCRDWPMALWSHWGRCGDCGERPEQTTKTVDEYMAERA